MIEQIKIVEMFKSFQGEGVNIGKPAFFVRFFGCNENCSFCDEPLHKNPKSVVLEGNGGEIAKHLQMQLLDAANFADECLVIFTGGEPTLYNLPYLITCMRYFGNAFNTAQRRFFSEQVKFAVETNGFGTECLRSLPYDTFVTISPKNIETFAKVDFTWSKGEVKIPLWMGGEDFFEACLAILCEKSLSGIEVWATPINGATAIDAQNNNFAVEYVTQANKLWAPRLGKNIRLNVQAHKVWNVR